jgi:hypothetical protein
VLIGGSSTLPAARGLLKLIPWVLRAESCESSVGAPWAGPFDSRRSASSPARCGMMVNSFLLIALASRGFQVDRSADCRLTIDRRRLAGTPFGLCVNNESCFAHSSPPSWFSVYPLLPTKLFYPLLPTKWFCPLLPAKRPRVLRVHVAARLLPHLPE